MGKIPQASTESIIDRVREKLVAKIVTGTANSQERAQFEELSSSRAALMKKPMVLERAAQRNRFFSTRST